MPMYDTRTPRTICAALMVCACAILSNASASDEESSSSDSAERAPLPPARAGHVTIVTAGFSMDRIVQKFTEQGVKVRARGNVIGSRIDSFIVRDVPFRDALMQLVALRPDWLLFEPADEPGTYEIWDEDSFKEQVLPKQVRAKVFQPRYINAADATKELYPKLTPKIGTATYDARTNKIFVTDLPPVLELFERMLKEIDVDFVTRVFVISHADPIDVAQKLGRMKSDAAPRPEVDERTRQVIVRDRLDVIRRMEQMVETIDIPSHASPKYTPLESWTLSQAGRDSVNITDEAKDDGHGNRNRYTLRLNEPKSFPMFNVDTTVTLLRVNDSGTSWGAEAVFRVEHAPIEIRLKTAR